jgi:hypothetical protein
VKGEKSVIHLRDCQLLKKGCALRVLPLLVERFPDSTDGIEAVG